MDDAIADLMEEYRKWQETELAAQQDVDDCEAWVIAADLKLQAAKDALKHVSSQLEAAQHKLADAIDDATAPAEIVFLADGDDE